MKVMNNKPTYLEFRGVAKLPLSELLVLPHTVEL